MRGRESSPQRRTFDPLDARLLLELVSNPRATVTALAQRTGVARNTAHSRIEHLERDVLETVERRLEPQVLGYPITAYVFADLNQKQLDEVGDALSRIPEVLEVQGISGIADLLIHVAARDAEDLYRVTGKILAIQGVQHTRTSIAMKRMQGYRTAPLLKRIAERE